MTGIPKISLQCKRILTTILLLIGLQGFSQNLDSILQKSVDFKPLVNHLKGNSMIHFGQMDLIANNGIYPEKVFIVYDSEVLRVNTIENYHGDSAQSFFDGYTFEFLKINVKRGRAHVIYKYYPYWHICETPYGIAQSVDIYFLVDLKFRKQGDWKLYSYEITDIDVTKLSDCKRDRYIRLE